MMISYRLEQEKHRTEIADIYSNKHIVFSTPEGMYLDSSNVRKSFKRLLKKADLSPNFRLHDLRHTFTTRLFEKNVAPKTVKTFIVHSTIKTTMNIYTHVMNETKVQAIDTSNDIFNLPQIHYLIFQVYFLYCQVS